MFQFEKDEWAENHGIQVGSCNIHNVRVWDGDCDECNTTSTSCLVENGKTGKLGWVDSTDWEALDHVDCDPDNCEVSAKWTCPDCGEFRYEDDRRKAGMKCGPCAYAYG